jgi:hypothetical protein
MKRKFATLALLVAAGLGLSGCATILGGGTSQSVSVASQPAGATFVIKASSGIQFASGASPQTVALPRKHEYQIEFTAPGYQKQTMTLTQGINGWFWVNLLFGGVVGMVIDGVDGAMHKLEPAVVNISLQRGTGDELFGVVRELDKNGHVISERKVELKREQ